MSLPEEKQGFMLYHTDLKLALNALDAVKFKNLFEFLLTYSKADSWSEKQKAYGLVKNQETKVYAEFFAEKLDRDSQKYQGLVRENTIKGLISALKRDNPDLKQSELRKKAEELYAQKHSDHG